MPWQTLDRFRDRRVPKLYNLRLANRAGLAVPETIWARAADLEADPPARLPDDLPDAPCIVRSASPTEDTTTTSNAGQLLSVVVDEPGEFAGAVARVVAALPRDRGRPLGAVFVQPVVRAETAGVSFFDGFYQETTRAAGSNADLTRGLARGEVYRGGLRRSSAFDAWLADIFHLFGRAIDVEWAIPFDDEGRPVLLQVRPALFPIRRDETLSLANHKEILGDPPSPWMTGVLAEAGRDVLGFFAEVDPAVRAWGEPYAVELGERAWLNFSAFFRLMDRWGLPRTMITDGVGGAPSDDPLDARLYFLRVLRHLPTFAYKALHDGLALLTIGRGLRRIDVDLDAIRTLEDAWDANVRALAFAIRTNFAIMSVLSLAASLRKPLGLARAGRVVTHAMMAEYADLASRPEAAERLAGLDAWLARHGHRGPLESDPSRPRFAELRETLAVDLRRGPSPAPSPEPGPSPLASAIARPFFLIDEVREAFRDSLMRRWQVLRARVVGLAERAVADGHLDAPGDVFSLRGDDLRADPTTWRDRVAARRALVEVARGVDPPTTATRSAIEAAIARASDPDPGGPAPGLFRGVGLGARAVSGTAVRRDDLASLLGGVPLPESPILVVATLEPSWAVVFPKFAAVVVELGGELSHASILLREAGIPCVINAAGAFRSIRDGAAIVVDPLAGTVRVGPAG